ncbi:hypothetical protein GCM10017752_04230 [Streptomyces roseoviridis]
MGRTPWAVPFRRGRAAPPRAGRSVASAGPVGRMAPALPGGYVARTGYDARPGGEPAAPSPHPPWNPPQGTGAVPAARAGCPTTRPQPARRTPPSPGAVAGAARARVVRRSRAERR